jgi:hypothetical protein
MAQAKTRRRKRRRKKRKRVQSSTRYETFLLLLPSEKATT